ncbi:hypothetical protein BC941DRAFT_423205 [Chlamydoabsidia padenii]|nr:hypothetical protein BC941DRAFT_423205 [Chlamydoabsidia padenii]
MELMELILTSKVEEDRRRTEEAKLKSKQLDYFVYLKKDESQLLLPLDPSSLFSDRLTPDTLKHDPFLESSGRKFQPLLTNKLPSIESLDRMNGSSFIFTPSSTPFVSTSDKATGHHIANQSLFPERSPKLPLPQESPPSRALKRRRREMQSITMIIETKEYPYIDNYHWKNNGNTVHKKSGQRSAYYKCANSDKGCNVNKTVTFKEHGEYLIKYRGKHLEECSTVDQNAPGPS